MSTRNTNPRRGVQHFKIFEYWKDKVICSNGEVMLGKNRPAKDYEWVVSDDAEPSCWGCGLPAESEFDREKRSIDTNDLPLIWNDRNVKHELERCHIVPRALGGVDEPNFNWESFKEYINENVGQHGFEVNRVSLINGYVDWLMHNFVEISLR